MPKKRKSKQTSKQKNEKKERKKKKKVRKPIKSRVHWSPLVLASFSWVWGSRCMPDYAVTLY